MAGVHSVGLVRWLVVPVTALAAACTSAHPGADRAAAGTTTAGSTAAAAPAVTARPNPSGAAFALAPPAGLGIGGFVPSRPSCSAAQIRATAVTRGSTYGVLGMVRLHGTKTYRDEQFHERLRCSLPVRRGPVALLDAGGRRLPVPRRAMSPVDPPSNPRADAALTNGDAVWGFSWLGSWCGPRPAAVLLPLTTRPRSTLRVPLTGATPRCAGHSSSTLVDGIAGDSADGVQPPAPAFAHLRLHLRVEPGTTGRQVADLDATLTTTGPPVVLSPCPSFAGRDWADSRGGFSDPLPTASLDCLGDPPVITTEHPLHFTVAGPSLTQSGQRPATRGSTVRLAVGIAGVAPATVTVRVR